MFRNAYQNGFLSILFSCGSAPLELWSMHVKNGYIRRITDEEVKSLALEIAGTNVATTYIYCPSDTAPKRSLAIRLPFLIMIIKNMKKYLTFEITILDDKNMHRRFRVSNFQSTTRVRPFSTSMPIGLCGGWNRIQFNLADITRRAYGTNYLETTRMQIHANCRIRRIYFTDRLYTEDKIPDEYRLLRPIDRGKRVKKEKPGEKQVDAIEKVIAAEPPAFEGGEEEEAPKETTEGELQEEELPEEVTDVELTPSVMEEEEDIKSKMEEEMGRMPSQDTEEEAEYYDESIYEDEDAAGTALTDVGEYIEGEDGEVDIVQMVREQEEGAD